MAEAAVTFLLETLTQQLTESYNLVSGAKTELGELQDDLKRMKDILLEAGRSRNKNSESVNLERRIRDAVYDVEDTIDSCLTHAATLKDKNFLTRSFLSISFKRFSLAQKVKSQREVEVKNIFERLKELPQGDIFGPTVEGPGTGKLQAKQVYLFKQENEVLPLEDVENMLICNLMKQTSELEVISIFGLPGKGKTTVARRICLNQRILNEFKKCIWIDVSLEFDMEDVLLKILKVFAGDNMPTMDINVLAENVRSYLQIEKFLLVIDGVGTTEDWDSIRDILTNENEKSKVLITTREKKVAMIAGQPHKMRDLDPEESWKLLELKVFGKLNNCPTALQEIGKRIAKQYCGLPQAITMVGQVLRGLLSKTPEMEIENRTAWKKVAEELNPNIANSLIELSYDKLPENLKTCFLYLGVFPKGYKIPVQTLTHLWIAEGLIHNGDDGKSLEENAKQTLEDLIDRDLVIAGETTFDGSIKTCRILNVIRQFCIFRAKTEHLFQEIRYHGGGFDPQASTIHIYRRLSIHSVLLDFLNEVDSEDVRSQLQRVRSFLCFCDKSVGLEKHYLSTIPNTFHLLRVLESRCVVLNEFPTNITKLIHLRYITLSFNFDVGVLPEALSGLWNLQILIIDTGSPTLIIKANIWKMIQLRHLKTKAEIIIQGPKKSGGKGNGNLQTLSSLSPKCCTVDVLKKAGTLKKLGVTGCLADLDFKFLKALGCLENLKLVNVVDSGSASGKPLQGLPSRDYFSSTIKRLTLSATYLEWRHMSKLAEIETLEVLKLKDNAFKGESWRVGGSCFPSLHFLIIDTTNLETWEASDYRFPMIKYLVIKNCEELAQIPLALAKTLQKLEIKNAKSAVKSAKEIEEESKKIPQGQKNIWTQARAPLILTVNE